MFTKETNNIEMVYNDETEQLEFYVDVNKELGKSGSGKTDLIATSRGNQKHQLPDGRTISIGINIYY